VKHLDEPVVARSREPELAQLGESNLPERDRVLRVASRDERMIGQRRQERRREALLKARDELRRQRDPEALGDRHTVPEAAMREEVVVLPLVPRAVGEQGAREMRHESSAAGRQLIDGVPPAEHDLRRHERGVVPGLAVRDPLVVDGDQGGARLDEAIAHDVADRLVSRSLEEVEGDTELEQPDRLDIRAEEDASRAEDVVAIRILEVPLGVAGEDRPRQLRVSLVAAEAVQQGGVDGALGEPEVIPVKPEAVVQLAAIDAATRAAAVFVGLERVEVEQSAVDSTASALARQHGLLARDVHVGTDQRLEVVGEGVG
jgi:hypothetical protein